MRTKAFWKSKMFWLNLVGGAVTVANFILQYQGSLPLLGISPEVIATLVMVANIIRRFTSSQAPLSLTGE